MEEGEGMNQFWAILELMGHVRLGGLVSEEEKFGVKMGRIDVPTEEPAGFVTQYFGGQSVYRLTPCTEEVARAVAKHTSVQPIHSYEMPRLQAPALSSGSEDDGIEEHNEEDDEGYF